METIERLNERLKDYFGNTEDLPNFRVVWSDDQFELRSTMYTAEGFALPYPVVRRFQKYAHYVRERWILESLTEVPIINEKDLPASKLSYEPLWVFEDPRFPDKAVYPTWPGIRFVIDVRNKNVEQAGLYTKYKAPTAEESYEEKQKRLKEIEDSLFGNETPVGDALAHKYGVVVPGEINQKEGE